MKRAGIIVLIAFAAACSSSRKDDELPSTIPPAEIRAQAPQPDPRIDQLQTTLTELLDRLDVLNARIAKLESGGQAIMPVQPVQPSQPSQPTPQGQARSPVLHQAQMADEYRRGIVLISQNKPAEARAVFQKVFDGDPSGDLADNALFWIGETYFSTGNYTEAMRFYERVVKEYPDQNKAPDAAYKIGVTYERTGDLLQAKRALDECIARYPYSTPAAAARMELKKIKY